MQVGMLYQGTESTGEVGDCFVAWAVGMQLCEDFRDVARQGGILLHEDFRRLHWSALLHCSESSSYRLLGEDAGIAAAR